MATENDPKWKAKARAYYGPNAELPKHEGMFAIEVVATSLSGLLTNDYSVLVGRADIGAIDVWVREDGPWDIVPEHCVSGKKSWDFAQ